MSSDAMSVYADHLAWQMGQDGHHTEAAIIDPSGEDEQTIYGIYDDNATAAGNRGDGNVRQRIDIPRFVTAAAVSIDVYANKTLQVRGQNYRIERIEPDANGANVIWLS